MSESTISTARPDKKKMQNTAQIFHILGELVELYPQYTIPQHLSHILRKKKSGVAEFFHWSNEQLLKRIENYKQELENDQLDEETEG